MNTIRIKTPVGKKLGFNNFGPTPRCPPSLAFSQRPLLGVGAPILEIPHIPNIVKCAGRKSPSTF